MSWWSQIVLLSGMLIAALVFLAWASARPSGESSDTPFVLLGAGALGTAAIVVVLLRHRVRADARGVTVRWVRSRLIPWDEISEIRVVHSGRSKQVIVVAHATPRATFAGRPKDPERFAEACADLRPSHAPMPTPTPKPADPEPPAAPVLALPTPWAVAVVATTAVLVVLLTATITLDAAFEDDAWLPILAIVAMCAGLFVGLAAWLRTQARIMIRADSVEVTIKQGSGVRRLAMAQVQRFVEVTGTGSSANSRLAILTEHEAFATPVPIGRGQKRSTELVDCLEALRHASASGADESVAGEDRAAFDARFRPPRIPPRPLDWLLPGILLTVAAAMLIAFPFGLVTDRHEVDRVQARSHRAVGTVTAVRTRGNTPTGLVRYDTTSGPVIVELDLLDAEMSGSARLHLRYDPDDPTNVWRTGGRPSPSFPGWAGWLLLGLLVPLTLGLTLWLRWHPPTPRAAVLSAPRPPPTSSTPAASAPPMRRLAR